MCWISRVMITTLIFSSLGITAQEEARILRFPAIYGNQIVFTYAGDLFTTDSKGGMAHKLTNHEGYEMFARFSPDGKQLAFTGQYDGNTEIFVIPSEGGAPKRLTVTATLNRDDVADRMGPNNIAMCWTPDGSSVVYRSRKQSFNSFVGSLFKVSIKGGVSEELSLPTGGFCSYSPDGKKLAFNRVFREFRTWKYYKGGMADDIWIYNTETKQTENITNNNSQDIFPMWYDNEIYFISDRDRTMNLFVYNTKTKETKKVSNFTEYDIKFPSLGDGRIVFENAGYIYVFDIASQKAEKITVTIADDFLNSRPQQKDASKLIHSWDISNDGHRVLFSARGDIFTVPAVTGVTRNLTQSSGNHDKNAVWSPDGKTIAYISDASGEFEIYTIAQDGKSKAVKLTKDADTYIYTINWSPDGKKILWSDRKMRLRYIDIETKIVTEVERSVVWEISQFEWSPDSKWITYSKSNDNQLNSIFLYSIEQKKSYRVTDEWYNAGHPVFSLDGKYLLFTSERDFDPIYNDVEWNFAYKNMSKIYMAILSKDTPSPLFPINNEVNEKSLNLDNESDMDSDQATKTTEGERNDKIDTDGIIDRIVALPIKASNYWGIFSVKKKIYYFEKEDKGKAIFKYFDLKTQKETELGNDIASCKLSSNSKRMLIMKEGKFYMIDLPSAAIKTEKEMDLSNMKVWVDLRAEWKQIYDESWRQMRDFFYDPGMHGVDWSMMHDKYGKLVPYVNHRNDLTYLIGELIGELNVGHAYTGDGDKPHPQRIKTGLLGAKISRHSSGYYKIDKILKGENWSEKLHSPLADIGVNVKEGEFIIAVNSQSTKDMNDIYTSLIDMAGKQVLLTVNTTAEEKGSRTVLVVPIEDESKLYYYNWVQDNIKKVNEATNGEVGYIHVPDMVSEGLNEFVKYFYPQLNKKALIIDDRGNGGGNVSPMLIERLKRELTRSNMWRNSEIPSHTPKQMLVGPKVLLINNYSASDGDLFPYSFKKHKIGKVIGLRSWGGVVGIRGSLPFIDGGTLTKPEFASYSSDESKWIIEGYGVDPDIIIDNDPGKEYAGEDQQLSKAIEVILEELKNNEQKIPPVPDFPDKSK